MKSGMTPDPRLMLAAILPVFFSMHFPASAAEMARAPEVFIAETGAMKAVPQKQERIPEDSLAAADSETLSAAEDEAAARGALVQEKDTDADGDTDLWVREKDTDNDGQPDSRTVTERRDTDGDGLEDTEVIKIDANADDNVDKTITRPFPLPD